MKQYIFTALESNIRIFPFFLKQILGAQVCRQLGTSIEDIGMNTV